jgi:hypothetical protein
MFCFGPNSTGALPSAMPAPPRPRYCGHCPISAPETIAASGRINQNLFIVSSVYASIAR